MLVVAADNGALRLYFYMMKSRWNGNQRLDSIQERQSAGAISISDCTQKLIDTFATLRRRVFLLIDRVQCRFSIRRSREATSSNRCEVLAPRGDHSIELAAITGTNDPFDTFNPDEFTLPESIVLEFLRHGLASQRYSPSESTEAASIAFNSSTAPVANVIASASVTAKTPLSRNWSRS